MRSTATLPTETSDPPSRVGAQTPTLTEGQYHDAHQRSRIGWRIHLLVLAGYTLITFFMTLPLPLELSSKVPGGGDAWQHIWNLWWVKDSLLHFQNPYHTDLLYYPEGVN